MKENLLFLAQRIPYPPNKGDKIRSWNFLKQFAQDYNVHLGTFIDDPHDLQYIPKLEELCVSSKIITLNPLLSKIASLKSLLTGASLTESYFYKQEMQKWANATKEKYNIDKIYIFSSAMAPYVSGADWAKSRRIMDFVDVDSDKWKQYAGTKTGLLQCVLKGVYNREFKTLANFETKIHQEFSKSIFVSPNETKIFCQQNLNAKSAKTQSNKALSIPNGIDTDYFSPDHVFKTPYSKDEFPLVFMGAMDYWPNIDAVCWFAESILPLVQTKIPTATFYILGSNPSKEVQKLALKPGVVVTGRVEDLRPYLTHSQAIIAPMRISRGIQNKILEGLAMAKPVITTSKAAGPLELKPNQHLLIADTEKDYVNQICKVQKGSFKDIGPKARQEMIKNFSWTSSYSRINKLLS